MASRNPKAGLYIFGRSNESPCKLGNTFDLAQRLSYLRRFDKTPGRLGLTIDQASFGYVYTWEMSQPPKPRPAWSGGMPAADTLILRDISVPRLTVGARAKNGRIWQRQTEWFPTTPEELRLIIMDTPSFQRWFGNRAA